MATVKEIAEYFDTIAPASTKMDFDNVGLLVAFNDKEVKTALIALDITSEVVAEAQSLKCDLVISHHPLFFDLKRVNDVDVIGRKIIGLISSGISALCLHTNMDAAAGGVNDALMEKLGAENVSLLYADGTGPDGQPYGISRVGDMKAPVSFPDFLVSTKAALASKGLRYYDAGNEVRRIACCGGSGGEDLRAALDAGCDTFLTADVKYHTFLDAKEWGINLIDADHFCTENVVVPKMAQMMEKFPEVKVQISAVHGQTVSFI